MEIYLVLTQTGSILSRLLKIITKAPYNHVSISLRPDLAVMYSFGRRQPYNPFWGGFVEESPKKGTFLRFPSTTAAVFALTVSDQQYAALQARLDHMLAERYSYRYDFLGLLLAAFHIHFRRQRYYYCSAFLKELLLTCQVPGTDTLDTIVQPVHFTRFPGVRLVYSGLLRDFTPQDQEMPEQ